MGYPSHRSYLKGVIVVLEGPSDGEEERADYSMSEHHEQCPCYAQWLHSSDSQEDKAHVGHG